MLRQEWRKTWSQRTTLLLLAAVCLAQVVYMFTTMDPTAKEAAPYYNAYAGTIDERWRQIVITQYQRLWGDADPYDTETRVRATMEQTAVLSAAQYLDFTAEIDAYVEALKAALSDTDPDYDVERVDAAYAALRAASEAGRLHYGVSPASEGMASQGMVRWAFVLFIVFLGVNQLSSDRSTGMDALLAVSKKGRRQLFRTQFAVFQLSALLVWLAANAALALTLTFYGGWGCPAALVQDFFYNSSPYTWNAWQVMAVALVSGLAASQVVSAAAFVLLRLGRTTAASYTIGAGVLVLPLMISMHEKSRLVALLLPNLVQTNWMWSSYQEFRLGTLYLKPWHIAALELILAAAAGADGGRRSAGLLRQRRLWRHRAVFILESEDVLGKRGVSGLSAQPSHRAGGRSLGSACPG